MENKKKIIFIVLILLKHIIGDGIWFDFCFAQKKRPIAKENGHYIGLKFTEANELKKSKEMKMNLHRCIELIDCELNIRLK